MYSCVVHKVSFKLKQQSNMPVVLEGERRLSDNDRNKTINAISHYIAELIRMSSAEYTSPEQGGGRMVIGWIAQGMLDLLLDGGIGGEQASKNYQTYVELLRGENMFGDHFRLDEAKESRLHDISHANETAAYFVTCMKTFFDMSGEEYGGLKGEKTSLQMVTTLCRMMRDADSYHQIELDMVIVLGARDKLMQSIAPQSTNEYLRYRLESMTKFVAAIFSMYSGLSGYQRRVLREKSDWRSDENAQDGGNDQFRSMGQAVQLITSATTGLNPSITGYHACMNVIEAAESSPVPLRKNNNVSVKLPKIRRLVQSMWMVRNDSVDKDVTMHAAINVRGDGSCFYQAMYYSLLWAVPLRQRTTYITLERMKKSVIDILFDDRTGEYQEQDDENVASKELVSLNSHKLHRGWAEDILRTGDRGWNANEEAVQLMAAALNVQILIYQAGTGKGAKLSMAFPAADGEFTGAPVMMFLRTGTSFRTGHFYILGLYPLMAGMTADGRGIQGEKYQARVSFFFYDHDHMTLPLLNAEMPRDIAGVTN